MSDETTQKTDGGQETEVKVEDNGVGRKKEKSFRLSRKKEWVVLEDDPDEPDARKLPVPPGRYLVRELSGAERDDWVNTSINRGERNEQTGAVVSYDPRDLEAMLVAKCLFNEQNVPVPLQKVRLFPSDALGSLYRLCEEMNGLNKVGQDKAKKA